MSPLQQIKEWYQSGDKEMKMDLAGLSSPFHLQEGIRHTSIDEMIGGFELYLDDSELKPNVIVQRTLFCKALISFCIDNRKSEEDWNKSLQFMKSFEESYAEKYPNETSSLPEMIQKFPERKEKWIGWAKAWVELLNNGLVDKKIADWYISNNFSTPTP